MNNLYKAKSKKTGEWVYGQYLFATQHHGKAVSKHWIIESVSQNGGHLCCGTKHAIDETTLCKHTHFRHHEIIDLYEYDKVVCDRKLTDGGITTKNIEGVIVYLHTLGSFAVSSSIGIFCLHECKNIRLTGNLYNAEEEDK